MNFPSSKEVIWICLCGLRDLWIPRTRVTSTLDESYSDIALYQPYLIALTVYLDLDTSIHIMAGACHRTSDAPWLS